jgi:hypothetical protein
MSLGDDIKSVIEETGVAFDLYRSGVRIAQNQKAWIKGNSQVTKPFIREFFLEGTLASDLSVASGDIMSLLVPGIKYMIMHVTKDLFENEAYRQSVVFYKANVQVTFLRPDQDRDPVSYVLAPHWTILGQNVDVVLTSPLYGAELNEESPVGPISSEVHEMYVPSSYNILPMDLARIGSEFLRVSTVKKRRYEGVDVLELSNDPSSMSTTTTTTTTATTTVS